METKETAAVVVAPTTTIGLNREALASDPMVPQDIRQMFRYANLLAKSHLVPESIRTPEDAFIVLATGHDLGLKPMQSLRLIHVVEGRAGISAELMAGLIRQSKHCESWLVKERSEQRCVIATRRRGDEETTTIEFTFDQAAKITYWSKGQTRRLVEKDNWRNYLPDMLYARCVVRAGRTIYPDVIGGLVVIDELEEIASKPAESAAPTALTVAAPVKATGEIADSPLPWEESPRTPRTPEETAARIAEAEARQLVIDATPPEGLDSAVTEDNTPITASDRMAMLKAVATKTEETGAAAETILVAAYEAVHWTGERKALPARLLPAVLEFIRGFTGEQAQGSRDATDSGDAPDSTGE